MSVLGRVLLPVMLAVVVAGTLGTATAYADADSPAHKDPRTVQEEPLLLFMLIHMGDLLELMVSGAGTDTSDLTHGYQSADVPRRFQFIFARYNELTKQLNIHLDAAERSLSSAASALDADLLATARDDLNQASTSLDEAELAAMLLRATVDAFGRVLFLDPDSARTVGGLNEPFARLQSLLDELAAFRERLAAMLPRLKAVQGIKESLARNPDVAYDRDPEALAELWKEIRDTVAPVPKLAPTLNLRSSGILYPGRATGIEGQVGFPEGAAPLAVDLRLSLDTLLIDSFTSPGRFEREILVPSDTTTGSHLLVLEAPPAREHAHARVEQVVEVQRVAPSLSVRVRKFHMLPGGIAVSGHVDSMFGPLQGAETTISLGDSRAQTRTALDGSFSGVVDVSPGTFLWHTLTVSVNPREPWSRSVSREAPLLIVTPASLVLASLVLVTATVVVTRRRYRWRAALRREPEAPAPLVERPPVMPGGMPLDSQQIERLPSPIGLDGPRLRAVRAHLGVVPVMGQPRSVVLGVSMTVREFLAALGAGISSAFVELTGLVERALYGGAAFGDAEAERAEDLAAIARRGR